MTRITRLDVIDVRFPDLARARRLGRHEPEPDYSAAYLVLRTDDPDLRGTRCSSRPGGATTSPARPCGRWPPTSSAGTSPGSWPTSAASRGS